MSDRFMIPRLRPALLNRHVRLGLPGEVHVFRDENGVPFTRPVPAPRQRVVLGSRPAQLPPGYPVTGAALAHQAVTA